MLLFLLFFSLVRVYHRSITKQTLLLIYIVDVCYCGIISICGVSFEHLLENIIREQ